MPSPIPIVTSALTRDFCQANDAVLKACIHLLHPGLYGSPRQQDLLAIARSSDEAARRMVERAEWFPDNRNAQLVRKLLDPKVREVLAPAQVPTSGG